MISRAVRANMAASRQRELCGDATLLDTAHSSSCRHIADKLGPFGTAAALGDPSAKKVLL